MNHSKPTPTNLLHDSLQPTVQPTGPYSSRPPSPPYIHVPPPIHPNLPNPYTGSRPHNSSFNTTSTTTTTTNPTTTTTTTAPGSNDIIMTIRPPPSAIHTTGLSELDLALLTRGFGPQSARDGASAWVYESRRRAQQVLDYLWLGPASAVKDRAFLAREGITMVLCARDARFAGSGVGAGGEGMLVAGAKRAVEGMGIEVDGVDVADGRELVGAFSVVVGRVNEHVLAVEKAAAAGGGGGRRGRVLVVCETGNDRSAAVVAAYLMAVYGLDTVQAVQFMQLQRFCVALGDDFKFQLQTYGDILRARGDVGLMGMQQQQRQGSEMVGGNVKRRIEQTMGEAEEGGQVDMMTEMDAERYAGRNFAPFVES
ncbi:phosphatases II [Parathielavia hyrcaniae]|uniref:Phosphatases II n=1 Tax=Parathielavia hyrcaniae TaxID=113614 RepID=A0AAN6PYP7_9PEZI|nr:phosphatases II [Parathielavia hyrcaniae]